MRALQVDSELAALATMSLAQLREKWPKVSDKPVPKVSAALLRLAIAWELQASVHGGHSRQTLQKLDQIARSDPATRSFSVVYLKGGRGIALDCVNTVKDYVQGRKLVVERAEIAAEMLADPETPLKELMPIEEK